MSKKSIFVQKTQMFSEQMLYIHIYITCGLCERKRICAGFLLFVYVCIAEGDPVIKRGNPMNRFNPTTCSSIPPISTK
jgi:hypothetical protein